jgi:hypothetical protein
VCAREQRMVDGERGAESGNACVGDAQGGQSLGRNAGGGLSEPWPMLPYLPLAGWSPGPRMAAEEDVTTTRCGGCRCVCAFFSPRSRSANGKKVRLTHPPTHPSTHPPTHTRTYTRTGRMQAAAVSRVRVPSSQGLTTSASTSPQRLTKGPAHHVRVCREDREQMELWCGVVWGGVDAAGLARRMVEAERREADTGTRSAAGGVGAHPPLGVGTFASAVQ